LKGPASGPSDEAGSWAAAREEREERLRFGARGTLPPARRASESPIAIACFRLVTFFPEPPDRSSPRFISCMAFSTFWAAFFPYLRVPVFAVDRFRSAISITSFEDRGPAGCLRMVRAGAIRRKASDPANQVVPTTT
jgi:hypothetical protein